MKEIEVLIIESLKDIKTLYLRDKDPLYKNKTIDSKILFPKYSDNDIRYSEQELKCIFLKKIESLGYYYSVETPSKYKYRFVDNDEPKVFLNEVDSQENYQSSMIDLSLYDEKQEKISHIEFKHGQCPVFPIQKDFLKMIFESDETEKNYFVHYLDNSDRGTIAAILRKYNEALDNIKNDYKNIPDLQAKREKVKVFVLFAGMKNDKNFFQFTLAENDIEHLTGEDL